MVLRNTSLASLASNYLFVEIARRQREFLMNNPDAKIISLGVGDTTHPLPECVVEGMHKKAKALGTPDGYTGYPEYNGDPELRRRLSKVIYNGTIKEDEIFISDGSKPDLARLQFLFPRTCKYAVQDPVYPVFVDQTVMSGRGGELTSDGSSLYSGIVYMPCTPENGFFPDLEKTPRTDIIIMCSPNNPTGAVATKEQLEKLVKFAKRNKSIIIYDASYADFISSSDIPRSIFEIEGAKEVAMETNSFSKMAGFTGVRLGWTVCPQELLFEDGSRVWNDWSRICATCSNGPPNISEAAGKECLTNEGRVATKAIVSYYMQNAKILREVLSQISEFVVYGGIDSPYIWARMASTKSSWEAFDIFLKEMNIIVTPGVGFGSLGESYVRFSAFAPREKVLLAAERIASHYAVKIDIKQIES